MKLLESSSDRLAAAGLRPGGIGGGGRTTALGAAYAAGLAVGVWPGLDDLRTNWRMDRRWLPGLDPASRQTAYHWWLKAVGRTFDWLEP